MHRRRQVTICHNAHAVGLPYRRLIGGGRARARGRGRARAGEAIYHPDEEKSITFQRHLSSPLSPSPALAARDLRRCVRLDT